MLILHRNQEALGTGAPRNARLMKQTSPLQFVQNEHLISFSLPVSVLCIIMYIMIQYMGFH